MEAFAGLSHTWYRGFIRNLCIGRILTSRNKEFYNNKCYIYLCKFSINVYNIAQYGHNLVTWTNDSYFMLLHVQNVSLIRMLHLSVITNTNYTSGLNWYFIKRRVMRFQLQNRESLPFQRKLYLYSET